LIVHAKSPHPEERPGGARLEGRTAPLRLPSVIGHRGAARTAPENTLAGLRRAKALGCDWVEFDVRLTGDGALVLCHDPLLDRTTSGSGLVSAQSLAAIENAMPGAGSIRALPARECRPWMRTFAGGRARSRRQCRDQIRSGARICDRRRGWGGHPAPARPHLRVLVSSFLPTAIAACASLRRRFRAGAVSFDPGGWRSWRAGWAAQ